MRHRHQIGLYDELQIDAEILDHVAEMPARSRSQAIERFIRIGYMVFVKQMQVQSSVEEACIPTPKGMPLRAPRTNGHEQLAGASQAPASIATPPTTVAPSRPAPAPEPAAPRSVEQPPVSQPSQEPVYTSSDPSLSEIESAALNDDEENDWTDMDLDPLARMAAKSPA